MKVFAAKRNWLPEEGLRLDAETYSEGALDARDRIRTGSVPWKRLSQVSRIFNPGRFGRCYVRDASRAIPFLSSSDMMLLDLNHLFLLSRKRMRALDRLLISAGWTLMSRSGTVGRTAYVRDEMDGMTASEHALRVIPDTSLVQPGYLYAFLSSSAGQAMIRQKAYGTVVQHIESSHIEDIPVPLVTDREQLQVHTLIEAASRARTKASRLLDEAGGYFDSLFEGMLSEHDHALAMNLVSSGALDHRLDAFHHVGWAAESSNLMGERIADLAEVISSPRVPRVYAERGIPFLSGIDVFNCRPIARVRLARHVADAFGAIVQRGDLAVQGSGQRYGLIGRAAYIGARLDGWAASHDLFRIRTGSLEATASVLAFLRSQAGRRAMLRHSYGTSIPHVNPAGIGDVRVPKLREALAKNCVRALDLREQADADEDRAIEEMEAWLA